MATKQSKKPGKQIKRGKKLIATKTLRNLFPPTPCGKV